MNEISDAIYDALKDVVMREQRQENCTNDAACLCFNNILTSCFEDFVQYRHYDGRSQNHRISGRISKSPMPG
jgi:hypothetical protein